MVRIFTCLTALSVVLMATSTNAGPITTPNSVAVQWGEIRVDGVRIGSSGNRFLNASGPNASNPADAYFRFDVSGLKAQFDAGFGAGNWSITDATISLTQSNFSGTTDGGVQLYHVADDTVAITNGNQDGDNDFSGLTPSTLVYGDWSTLPLGNADQPILSYTFAQTATGDVDSYSVADGLNVSSIDAWLQGNDFLTFVLVADDLTVASYKGNEFSGRLPPQISLTAVPEPSTLVLLLVGSIAAAGVGRRFRKR